MEAHAPRRRSEDELLKGRAPGGDLDCELLPNKSSERVSYIDVVLRKCNRSEGERRQPRLSSPEPLQPARIRLRSEIHQISEAAAEAEGWHTVQRKIRCRRLAASRSSRKPLPPAMDGRCFNCLEKGHRKYDCREPTRCWMCRRPGHRSFECYKSKIAPNTNSLDRSWEQVKMPREAEHRPGRQTSGDASATTPQA